MIFYLQCSILIALGIFIALVIVEFDFKALGVFFLGILGIILFFSLLGWCVSGIVDHFENRVPPTQQTIERQ